jgi:AcrR family transcriptional regulator
MVMTPWGNAEELRDRKIRPGPGVPREEVVRSQRERLFAAMVATVADQGYAATTVADLVALSGVSRTAFYQLFVDRQDCFVATMEEILKRTSRAVSARYDGRGSALQAFMEQIVAQPAAARMCFVESFSAGPDAVALMDQTVASFEGLYQQAFDAREDGLRMPAELVQAIVGGLRKVIYTRLRRSQAEELSGLAGPLARWSLGYEPPSRALKRRVRQGHDPEAGIYRSNKPAERIVSAATEAIAERGYTATTIAEIVDRASASLSTFYEHFDDKEDVFVAALDAGQAQMLAVTLPAYRRAKEWPAAVRVSYETMLDFLAAHPAFARIALVEILSGTTRALERRDNLLESLFVFLNPGYEQAPKTEPIAAEAIGGAAYELVYRQVRDSGPEDLPQITPFLTYITLAPFLGAEESCAVANGDGRGRSRGR